MGGIFAIIFQPEVVQSVTGEVVTTEELGGANIHSTKSGVSHFLADNDEENLLLIRKLMSYLPSNNLEEPPSIVCDDPIDRLDDILNEIERSENSKMKMSEKEKSQKSRSRVESFKNGEENNERFVVTNKEVDEE